MEKKIRLGNCEECEGYVLVDIADDRISPLLEECRHCGAPVDESSVIDVPLTATARDRADADAVCDNCGDRWEDADFRTVIDELGGCPSCKPDAYGSLPVDS